MLCTITHALLAGNKSSSLTLLRHSRRQKAELNSALSSAVTLLRLAALFHRRRRRLSSLLMRAPGVVAILSLCCMRVGPQHVHRSRSLAVLC